MPVPGLSSTFAKIKPGGTKEGTSDFLTKERVLKISVRYFDCFSVSYEGKDLFFLKNGLAIKGKKFTFAPALKKGAFGKLFITV